MDSYFILATKHLWFTLVKVALLESVWRGLDWRGGKASISDLQDIKMLQQCIWLILYPARGQKPWVLEGFIKAHCLQEKHREKKCFKDTHTHTHTHTHVHIHMHIVICPLWVSVHDIYTLPESDLLEIFHCFTASGPRTPATFLAINVRYWEMILWFLGR